MNDQLSQYGLFFEYECWLADYERWAESSKKETAEAVAAGFRAGKLSNARPIPPLLPSFADRDRVQVPEILAFQNKLQRSFVRRAAAIADGYFKLLFSKLLYPGRTND